MLETGFFWILLACALYGALHSLLASHRVKAAAARLAGGAVYRRYYRLFFSIIAAASAAPVLALVALLPDRIIYRIPAPWVYLTTAIQGLAVLIIMAGVLQTGLMAFIGLKQIMSSTPRRGAPGVEKLVVNGLYRWVRHPLYAASILLLWLTPLMSWNILALNVGFSTYMLVGTIFEEQKLLRQFGLAYHVYRERTPRIIPSLGLGRGQEKMK